MHAQFQMSGTKTWWVHGLKWMVKILIIPLEINNESPLQNQCFSNPSWPSFPRCNAGKFHASAFTCSNSARARSACKQVPGAELQKNRHCRVVQKKSRTPPRIFKHGVANRNTLRNYPSSVQYSLKWELHPAKTILS